MCVVGVCEDIVLQTLHRLSPSVFTRCPVDTVMYDTRVDVMNMRLINSLNHARRGRSFLWRLSGFWSPSCQGRRFALDGCHLSAEGQLRLVIDVRAALVAILRVHLMVEIRIYFSYLFIFVDVFC